MPMKAAKCKVDTKYSQVRVGKITSDYIRGGIEQDNFEDKRIGKREAIIPQISTFDNFLIHINILRK